MAEDTIKVDLNDANLQVESLEINPDADAFSFPPPPPEGTYLAKLLQKKATEDSLWGGKKDKQDKLYLFTQIEARLIIADSGDPKAKYDGWPVFDNFVSTMIMPNSGTSRVAGILKALGVSIPRNTSHKELAQLLTEKLASEPTCYITVQWRASAEVGVDDSTGKKKYKEVKGMKRFPADGQGGYRPSIEIDGVEAQAQAQIVSYSQTADKKGAAA